MPSTLGRLGTAALVAITLVLGACSDGGGDGSNAKTADGKPEALTPFTSDEAKFKASFPGGTPERQEEQVPSNGQNVRLLLFTTQPDKDTAYSIGWFKLPNPPDPAAADSILEGTMNGSINAVKGELLQSNKVQHDGHPAIEYRGKSGPAYINARAVLVGQSIYFVQTTGRAEVAPRHAEFVDSFEVLPG